MNLELRKLLDFINFHPSIEVEEVQETAHQALALSESINNLEGKIISRWAIGLHEISKGHYKNGEDLLSNALILSELSEDKSLKGRVLSALGGLFFQKNQFRKSLDYLLEALKYIDPFWEGATFNTIGLIYRDQGQFEQSDEYLQKAIYRAIQQKNFSLHISALLNFANNKVLQREFDSALKLYQETLEKSISYEFKRGHIYSLIHLTSLYEQLKHPEKALCHCEDLIQVAKKEKYLKEYVRGLQKKGEILIQTGRFQDGVAYSKQALAIAQEQNFLPIQKEVLLHLSQQMEAEGHLAEALRYLKKVNQLHQKELTEKDKSAIEKKLSEQKDQINLLNNQKEKISKQNDELKQYAYIVAHDLKEPLRNISSFATLLQRRYAKHLDKDGQDFVGFIQNGAKHMYQQLEDLLIFATVDDLQEKATEIDLHEILGEVIFSLRNSILASEAKITCDPLPTTIFGIKIHFTQLFQNLLQNALKFRHPDRPPCIAIRLEEKQKFFLISVQDNGIGIDLKYQKSIFKIFRRLDRQNFQGTGIGLAICQKIVKLYEGNIWVESNDGEGSVFCFTLSKNGLPKSG